MGLLNSQREHKNGDFLPAAQNMVRNWCMNGLRRNNQYKGQFLGGFYPENVRTWVGLCELNLSIGIQPNIPPREAKAAKKAK